MIDFSKIRGFDWDKGNIKKNMIRHNVSCEEAESVFIDENLQIYKDELHSGQERRFIVVGKTNSDRLLYIAFTVRNNKIRVISARDLNNKEKYLYEK